MPSTLPTVPRLLALEHTLRKNPATWLITGVAGFIGSHLLETLLAWDQRVIGLDNLSTGFMANLDDVSCLVSAEQWARFSFIQGDIRELSCCQQALAALGPGYPVDYLLHQAALGSVPRSLANPIASHDSNVNGFLNMCVAAREAGVKNFVFASSSSTYGDHPDLPKKEACIGEALSPYALTKQINEMYARVFHRCYGSNSIGLRYFNVFGPRQNIQGPYAAVIPRWITACLQQSPAEMHGNGQNSRDFCYVKNAVQANLLAATTQDPLALNRIYNIAVGQSTSLQTLFASIKEQLLPYYPQLQHYSLDYTAMRDGDVPHSLAEIEQAKTLLGYQPSHRVAEGLTETIAWYRQQYEKTHALSESLPLPL